MDPKDLIVGKIYAYNNLGIPVTYDRYEGRTANGHYILRAVAVVNPKNSIMLGKSHAWATLEDYSPATEYQAKLELEEELKELLC